MTEHFLGGSDWTEGWWEGTEKGRGKSDTYNKRLAWVDIRFCGYRPGGRYRVCRKITMVSILWSLGCSTHVEFGDSGEDRAGKWLFTLISPIGVVARATSTPLGCRWCSSYASGGSEAPPHLFFARRSRSGPELLGWALLLGGDDVAVQNNFFCQLPVTRRRQMYVVSVHKGANFSCFFGEWVMRC